MNKLYAQLLDKNMMFDYVLDILANRYSTSYLEQNMATFMITEADYKDFIRYVSSRSILIDPKQLAAAKPLIYNGIKALLYKYYLGEAGYCKALNLNDNMVKQALTSLQ